MPLARHFENMKRGASASERLRGHPRTTAGDRRRDVELGAVVRVKRYGGNLGAEVDAREAAKDGEPGGYTCLGLETNSVMYCGAISA